MFHRLLSRWCRPHDCAKRTERAVDDRRVWLRHSCALEATLQPAGAPGHEPFAAHVQNISRGGIKLVVGHLIKPGEMVSVELPAGGASQGVSTVLACVLRAQATAEGQWTLNCAFASPLTDGELAQFGIPTAHPRRTDQRARARLMCQARASFQVVGADSQQGGAAVSDVSATGIGLIVPQPVEVGTLLSLELQKTGGRPALTMLASVVRVRPHPDGGCALGCNFIGELAEEDLRALV
jgi:hypothetical protein